MACCHKQTHNLPLSPVIKFTSHFIRYYWEILRDFPRPLNQLLMGGSEGLTEVDRELNPSLTGATFRFDIGQLYYSIQTEHEHVEEVGACSLTSEYPWCRSSLDF